MAGVGQEPSLLQRIPLCGLGSPDAVEHVVQGAAEAPISSATGDTGSGSRAPSARSSPLIAAARCRSLDRTQGKPGNPVADTTGGDQGGAKSDHFHTQDRGQRLGPLVQGVGNQHDERSSRA